MNSPANNPPVDELRAALARELDDHRALLVCLEQKREAVRVADVDAITRLCEEEMVIVQRLTALEQTRAGLITRASVALRPNTVESLTLSEIADALDAGKPGAGETLRVLTDALRHAADKIKRDSTVVANAARSLIRHVAGVMQVVNGALSRGRLYERRGRIAMGSQTEFSVDVTS